MDAAEQLAYIEKIFKQAKRDSGLSSAGSLDAGTLYALVFLPSRAKGEVLAASGEKYYKSISGLDTDRDRRITKTDLAQRLYKSIPS